jgi:hypothetical protein
MNRIITRALALENLASQIFFVTLYTVSYALEKGRGE